jgi:hypothetical protein
MLGIDVDAGLGELIEQLRQEWDRLGARHPGLADLIPREVGDPTRPVGETVEGVVVEGDHGTIGCEVDVGLQVPVAQPDGMSEGGKGILGPGPGTTPVGEGKDPGMVEEGVQPGRRW